MKNSKRKSVKSNVEKIRNVKPKKKVRISNIGKTFKCSDNDLPHKDKDSNKIVNIAILDENKKQELAGVRLTTKETSNAIPFKVSKHKLYKGYKTFLITEFQDGSPIKEKDTRISENPWRNNLSKANMEEINNKIYYHSKQSLDNRQKHTKWKNK